MAQLNELAVAIRVFLREHPGLSIDPHGACRSPSKLWGQCYVASEAMWHAAARKEGFAPVQGVVFNVSHWFLRHPGTGEILDLTADQFASNIWSIPGELLRLWQEGRGRPFLSSQPSKRARIVLEYLDREGLSS